MSLTVVTGVGPRWEAALAELLGGSASAQLVRRCADVPELLGVAGAGLARVAVVSCDFRSLDRAAVETLLASGVAVVGVHPPGEADGARALRRWGIRVVVPVDLSAQALDAAIDEAVDGVSDGDAHDDSGEDLAVPGPAVATQDGRDRPPACTTQPDGAPAPLAAHAPDPVDEELRLLLQEDGEDDPDGPPTTGRSGDAGSEPAPGQVIVVWGPGSPGRTTVAVNLAAELADALTRVVLVDADTYGASVAQLLAVLDEAPGLAAATRAADQGTLDRRTLDSLAPEVRPGLQLLSGLPRAERWPEIRDSALAEVLEAARGAADYVVVDVAPGVKQDEELSFDTLAPRRNGATLTALEAADRVVVVGAGDPVGLQRLVRGLDALPALTGAPRDVVITRVRPGPVGPEPERRIQEALERFAGAREVHLVPEDRESVDAALLHGGALAEVRPASPARASLRQLADLITGRVPSTRQTGLRWWPRRERPGPGGGDPTS